MPPPMAEDIEIRRKRLLHRSRYTGIKETDILLGAFAEAHLPTFDEGQLDRYEALLESGSDLMIYAWTVGAKPVPPEYDNDIMALLKAFKLKV
jgi:antitoxin CptB